jgi:hypothetical protein
MNQELNDLISNWDEEPVLPETDVEECDKEDGLDYPADEGSDIPF